MVLMVFVPGTMCDAATVEKVSGSAVAAEGINGDTYLQEEFEDADTKDFLKIYNIGVLVGFGLATIVYIIGIGAGSFSSVLKDAK